MSILVVYDEATKDEELIGEYGISLNAKIFKSMLNKCNIKNFTFLPLSNKNLVWQHIKDNKPKTILTLGALVSKTMINKKIQSINDKLGTKFKVEYCDADFYVLPSLHSIGIAGKKIVKNIEEFLCSIS